MLFALYSVSPAKVLLYTMIKNVEKAVISRAGNSEGKHVRKPGNRAVNCT
jgi:molybdenum cofactor biosynthesis enzyme